MKSVMALLLLCTVFVAKAQEKGPKKYLSDVIEYSIPYTSGSYASDRVGLLADSVAAPRLSATILDGVNIKLLEECYFSPPTRNRLFSKRLAYYLSGSNDLSLFRNFATVNTNGFSVGNTFSLPNDPLTLKDIKFLINTGLRIPLTNKQAVVFQNGRVQQGLTAFFNIVFVGKGKVNKPSRDDVEKMYRIRDFLEQSLYRQIDLDATNFDAVYGPSQSGYPDLTAEKRALFDKAQTKKYRELFHEEEEAYGLKMLTSLRKHWFVVNGEIPLNELEYRVAEESRRPRTEYYKPFIIGLQYGAFTEYKNSGLLFTFDAKLRNDNIIRFYNDFKSNVKQDSLASFGRRFGVQKATTDSTFLSEQFSQFGTVSFTPRLFVSLPTANLTLIPNVAVFSGVAFSAFPHVVISPRFHYTNANASITFSMNGRDGKPINLELLGTWVDVFNNVLVREAKGSRFTLTASVAIPLSSMIF